MSSSVSSWLTDYLIKLAEEYGGDTSKFPETGKKKSVQLTKFIFYGSTNPKEMSPIWAQVSDKVLEIPVKFSSESVAAYVQEHKSRLTQNKTCLIKLKKYKLSFGRIPIRVTTHPNPNADNLSKDPFLFLDVTAFEVMGSINEDIWCKDTLKSVEGHAKIKEWVMGLRKGGGDGNVLKLRKRELDARQPPPPCKPHAKQTRLEMPARAEPLKPKPKLLPTTTPNDIDTKGNSESFARQRERDWNPRSKCPQNHIIQWGCYPDPQVPGVYGEIGSEDHIDTTRETAEGSPKRKRKVHPLDLGFSQPELDPRPVQQVSEKNNAQEKATRTERSHPLDLGSSQPQKEEQHSGHSNDTEPSQQATPPPSEPAHESEGGYSPAPSSRPLTEWSSSPRGCPTPRDVQIIKQSSPCLLATPRSSSPSRSSSFLAAPPTSVSSLRAPTPAQRCRVTYPLPDLSRNNYEFSHRSDHSNSSPSCVMGTYRSSALDSQMYAGMVRVVSPPRQPGRSPVDLEASPRILVPCSDSGSQSQSQSQSQGSSWENQEHVAVKEENAESQKASLSQSSVYRQQDLQGEKSHSLSLPTTTKRIILSQESIVPETQPKLTIDGETEDEEIEESNAEHESLFEKTRSQALSQEQDSLEVHPGTQDGDTCVKPSHTAQDGLGDGEKGTTSSGSGPSQPQTDQDDDQTMQSLFGTERVPKTPCVSPAIEKQGGIHFIPHDATAWKQPAFMKRNAVASSSRPLISPRKALPVERQHSGNAPKVGSKHDPGSATRKMHNARPSALALDTATSGSRLQSDMIPIQQAMDVEVDDGSAVSVKARSKKRAIDDDETTREAERPVRKKTKVKASELQFPCGKLNGFSLGLDNQSNSGSLVTWDRLQSILLKTGRERSKQYAREGLRR
ncbi:hypothetical protein Moror_436 [Moniliophthora roreri MCA 2997]|uniref:Shelterin complex subunit TPP1/Est3 domain-containing protein n=1 Tax=Moniliophthora roreri (strain MCA 2997) TaxID=1381753 RepID=V2Y042_MONRO|nr:hypothetical protein Moror_436 [Moniliophthora roreri MCA 2997]